MKIFWENINQFKDYIDILKQLKFKELKIVINKKGNLTKLENEQLINEDYNILLTDDEIINKEQLNSEYLKTYLTSLGINTKIDLNKIHNIIINYS